MVVTLEAAKEILLKAVGEDPFDATIASNRALFQCLFPDRSYTELRSGDVHQDQRLTVEQYIQGLVFTVGCDAEASGTRILQYRHPLANDQIVLKRLLDMVLSMCDSNLLEPGFIFTMIERLVEIVIHPSECHDLIDWILENKEILKHDHVFERGKLILLRTVNRMLKILQRVDDCAFYSGRLLFFMSELYPMAERSATNHSGLRDVSHPVKTYAIGEGATDDVGRSIDKSVYQLYWKVVDHVQKHPGSESEVTRVLDLIQRLVDFFKSHSCRRDTSPYLSRTPVTLVNTTIPEQFNDIIREPDCRMESLVQICIYIQRLLLPSKNPVVTSDAVRQRMQSTQSDIEHTIQADQELKQRWTTVKECLRQETWWIEWKNEGAADWTLPAVEDHPWLPEHYDPVDDVTVADVHGLLDASAMETAEEVDLKGHDWEMKAAEGLHGQFNRDLHHPDFDELRVPDIKEFLGGVLEDKSDLEANIEMLEGDTLFCWRTYRLLSEHEMQRMVNAEHRTNFGKLLEASQSLFTKPRCENSTE